MFCFKSTMIGTSKSIWGFDPRSVPGCQLWLDGADTSTLTGSSPVTAWRDKSLNSVTLTATGAPTQTTVNGLNSLSFNGSSYFSLGPYTSLFGTKYVAWFAVANVTNAASANWGCIAGTGYVSDNYAQNLLYINFGSLAVFYRRVRGDGGKGTTVPLSAGNVLLSSATDFTTGTYQVFQNGTAGTLQTDGHTGTVDTQAVILRVGYTGFPGESLVEGTISEILLYTDPLTITQRQSIEGYLAAKWGLQSSVPTIHPFYTIRPFNRYFNPTDIPGCSLWLDGADNSSMNSTTTVTSWSDKSGLNNTMTGTATWTGRAMSFNGSTQAFSNTSYVFPISNYSMFAVYSNTTAPAASAYMNVVYGSNGFPMLGTFDVAKNVSARSVVANTGALVANVAASSNVLVSATYTPSTFSPFINGTTATTLAGTTLATTGIFVGGPSNYFNGTISELLIYSTNLSAVQRQRVEGYLIQKWALSAQTLSNHPHKLIPPATSQPAQYSEVTQGNWTRDWQPYLQSLARANATGVTVSVTTITGGATFPGSAGWCGGVLAPNGNIYFAPTNATNTLMLNPTTGVSSNVTGGISYAGTDKALGGVLAPNGIIYFTPYATAYTMAVNSASNTITTLTGGATYAGGWIGGVVAANGNIYFAPYSAPNILTLNPITGVTSNITGGATFTSWVGGCGVLGPNGNIYFPPYSGTSIIGLNPYTNITSNITGGASYTSGGWFGGVLAPNGSIYFAPRSASNILVLNPSSGITSNITGGANYTGSGWNSGVLGPDGNIYFLPFTATNILVLNPTTGVTTNTTGGATLTSGGWNGGVIALNGSVYMAPWNTSSILRITFNGVTQPFSSNYVLSAYANKF